MRFGEIWVRFIWDLSELLVRYRWKVGGIWVNIGPLLWHYAEQDTETQVQISLEELEHLIP